MPETPREIIEAWTDSDACVQGLLDDLDRQGYAIVPKEPTAAMLDASWQATAGRTGEDYMNMAMLSTRRAHDIKIATRYRAMLRTANP